jgi:hypothetical protein
VRPPVNWIYILAHAILIILGFALLGRQHAILSSVGASLVAAGISGWVVFVYVLASATVAERLEMLSQFGIVAIFNARAARIKEQYDDRLAGARGQIDILGFGLRTLRQDYRDEIQSWRERAAIRILLLDPEFPSDNQSCADQRDFEEQNPAGTNAGDVRNFVRDTKQLLTTNGSHPFQIRLYRCLPSINIFRIDDDLFWGPYLIREASRNSPTMLVRRGGLLFERLCRHFETIWNDPDLSRPVPHEWLE